MRARQLIAGLAILAMALISSPVQAGSGASTCWNYKASERKFARKINRARSSRSIAKLRLDPELSKAARVQTRKMIRNRSLFHTRNLGSKVTNWTIVGENVGMTSGGVDSLHRAFMNSSGHRANILRSGYRFMGVGARRSADGRLWVTVIFSGVRNPGTSFKMPSC